jgi:hypothetical protein
VLGKLGVILHLPVPVVNRGLVVVHLPAGNSGVYPELEARFLGMLGELDVGAVGFLF